MRPLGALSCVCGVLGLLAPVHWCACSVRCVACAVSWATWILFTGMLAGCAALRVSGVLGHLAPVLRFARSVWFVACAVSWASLLLSTVEMGTGTGHHWIIVGSIHECNEVMILHKKYQVCNNDYIYVSAMQTRALVWLHPPTRTQPKGAHHGAVAEKLQQDKRVQKKKIENVG